MILGSNRIIDEMNGIGEGVMVERLEKEKCFLPPIQKKREDGYCIIGTDVKALFPSLTDVESARMTRCAILQSEIKFGHT